MNCIFILPSCRTSFENTKWTNWYFFLVLNGQEYRQHFVSITLRCNLTYSILSFLEWTTRCGRKSFGILSYMFRRPRTSLDSCKVSNSYPMDRKDFLRVCIPHFLHPFIQTLRWFSYLDYCEYRCSEREAADTSSRQWLPFLRIYTQKWGLLAHVVVIFLIFEKSPYIYHSGCTNL